MCCLYGTLALLCISVNASWAQVSPSLSKLLLVQAPSVNDSQGAKANEIQGVAIQKAQSAMRKDTTALPGQEIQHGMTRDDLCAVTADTERVVFNDAGILPPKREPDIVNVLVLDFFATIHAVKYENSMESSQIPQLNAYYNVSINNLAKTKHFSLRTFIYNEYGFRYYFDSLTVKTEDNFRVRNNIQVRLHKNLSVQGGFEIRTQLWKKWEHRTDTMQVSTRYLYTDYYSPGYSIYSLGAGITILENAAVYLGLVGGKITRIRNQQIFDDRGAKKLYGVDRGEVRKVEWGLNLLASVPPQLVSKHFGWEASASMFAPKAAIGRLKSYTAESTIVLHYMFLKHMRLSLRSQMQYDESIQSKVFISNWLSLGFYVSNKL